MENVSVSHIINVLKKHNVDHYDRRRLTINEVKEIRGLAGDLSYSQISRKYGVTLSTISEIVKGITWQNKKEE